MLTYKAMNLVHANRQRNLADAKHSPSVLQNWLMSNAGASIAKFATLESSGFASKLKFSSKWKDR